MGRAEEDEFQQIWKGQLMDYCCLRGHGRDPSDFGFKVRGNPLRTAFCRLVSLATGYNMGVGRMTEIKSKVERPICKLLQLCVSEKVRPELHQGTKHRG